MAFGRLGSLCFGRLGGGGGISDPIIPGTIRARTGTFILTGNDASLLNLVLTADVGTFTLTGNDAAFTTDSAPPAGRTTIGLLVTLTKAA